MPLPPRESATHVPRAAHPSWAPARPARPRTAAHGSTHADLPLFAESASGFAQLLYRFQIGAVALQFFLHGRGQMIALLVRWKRAMLHVFAILLDCSSEKRRCIRIPPCKLRLGREAQVHHVVKDENLPVA